MAVTFDQIVPWGRSLREYELMFSLEPNDFSEGVLDCGGGPASFTAELTQKGIRATAVDPIYAFSGDEIQSRFDALVEPMMAQIRASPDDWTWGFHSGPDDLRANRRKALDGFLGDYGDGKRDQRYLTAELPTLPFEPGSFGLAVCSHLLFLYSDLLSEEFHVRATFELCRVAREVRIFPLLTLARKPSPHVQAVQNALEAKGWQTGIERVNYELQRDGNQMLRVFSRKKARAL
jgi:SAM-dependent methyltransferase